MGSGASLKKGFCEARPGEARLGILSLSGEFIEILKEKGFDDNWDVLSLGCGIGQGELGLKNEQLTGVDIWDYSLQFPSQFIKYDIRKIKNLFPDNSFDLIMGLDIIEHLTRRQGFKLIRDSETIARKAVVFYTPIKWGDNKQDESCWAYGNPYNDHKSLWQPEDFKGYEIRNPFPAETSDGFLAIRWL